MLDTILEDEFIPIILLPVHYTAIPPPPQITSNLIKYRMGTSICQLKHFFSLGANVCQWMEFMSYNIFSTKLETYRNKIMVIYCLKVVEKLTKFFLQVWIYANCLISLKDSFHNQALTGKTSWNTSLVWLVQLIEYKNRMLHCFEK